MKIEIPSLAQIAPHLAQVRPPRPRRRQALKHNTHSMLVAGIAVLLACLAMKPGLVQADESRVDIKTNNVHMSDAPKWLTGTHIDKVVDSIQSKMEWDIRRVEVHWYFDNASFESANSLGPSAIAITRRSDSSVHLGPKVTEANFDQVFGHELVHVISQQKYKGAIPAWLEEGLANHLSHYGKVDYRFLASQPPISDVKQLVHPYNGTEIRTRYVYGASQALAEMISSKCDITDLLRMSVGRKLENYLANICNISDVNTSFKQWIASHAKG